MDLTYSCALGHYPPTPHTFQARRLRMDRPKTVKPYQDRHRLNVLDCSLLSRQFNLERSLLPGIPLTAAQSLKAECIDDLRTKSMLKAERKYRHLFTGGVCFSLKVAEPPAVLIFWELVISRRKGVDVSSRRIKRQKKAAKVTKAVALMEMKELEAEFQAARKVYRVAKKGHRESQIAFTDTFPAKDRDRIKQNETAREMGRMAKLITGKLESKKVSSVLYQGRTYNTKQGIDQVLLPVNEAKV